MNLIEEGMVIKNCEGLPAEITSLTRGRHGIRYEARSDEFERRIWAFLPYELPPIEGKNDRWYNWAGRASITLPSGMKLGEVVRYRNEPHTIEDYDQEWERTIETIRKGEQDAMPKA